MPNMDDSWNIPDWPEPWEPEFEVPALNALALAIQEQSVTVTCVPDFSLHAARSCSQLLLDARLAMEVLGISRSSIDAGLAPLDYMIRFDGHWSPMSGYFHMIAPAFQEFTLHGDSIEGLHVLARADGPSLKRGLEICAEVEANILSHPDVWREVLGTITRPGQPEIPYQLLIVRRRALAMIHGIRKLFEIAQTEKRQVIFANGTFDMTLSGCELLPGVEYYS